MTEQAIGFARVRRQPAPYESFMEAQALPVVSGVGVYDLRDVELAPWRRMGARGAFIQLDGTAGLTGMYLVEIPAGGTIQPEHHLYEELFYVLEGRGTTEIWTHANAERRVFEWSQGALFSVPLNTWHRLVNAASAPALLLGVTNAPPIFNVYRHERFVFDTPVDFPERYDGRADYFRPEIDLTTRPDTGRYHSTSNLIPDLLTCDVPYDGQRGAGAKHFTWNLAGNTFLGHVAEYPVGRYSKCHAHESGPVLLCLKGHGYSVTWPKEAGIRPWEAGNGRLVKRQDYVAGGLVSAAPGDANWFHGHFATSKEPLRVIAFLGGFPRKTEGAPGEEHVSRNVDIKMGGNTIEYEDEDPRIRETFKEELAKSGAPFSMPDEAYAPRANA